MTVARSLIVSSTPYETRAALLEGGVVAELFFERDRQSGVAGNIYRGRVRKILPGMQSAFVDVGLEKDAFLYVSDVIDPNRPATDGVSDAEAGAEEAAPVEVPIEKRLTEGQEIDVQVAKEPMAGKGARVTTHISLPGRYLVYMPTVKHLGVSRRIENEEERSRLKEIMEEIRTDEDGGFIVRTASEGVERDELEADAIGLRELSALVSESMKAATAPALVHSELGLLDKLLRDRVVVDFDEIIVDTVADRDVCLEFLRRRQSDLKAEVRLHSEPEALFEHYGLEREIDKALRSKVWLKSGGYLVINQTEALVSIDVNTGRFVGKVNLEETARSTNLEAARESARQIRLRSLGGIIVIDFIDMEKESNREELTAEQDRDRADSLRTHPCGAVG